MPFPIIPNSLKSKGEAAGEASPLPPLSLANLLLDEGSPTPLIRRRTSKPYSFGSTYSLSRLVFVGGTFVVSASFTMQMLSWCVHWYGKNVFIKVSNNVTRFLTTGIIRAKVDWGDLPTELWGEIGKRLASRIDIVRFRSACKKWRSSLPPPTLFPLRVPPPPSCDRKYLNVPFFITEVSVYRRGDELGALVFEEVDKCGKFLSHYSLLGAYKIPHPLTSFLTSPAHPYYRHSLVGKAYHLRMGKDFHYNEFANKMVIISSNAEGNVNPSYVRVSDLSVVAHLSWGRMKGRLALLRLGGSPKNWVWETDFCTQVFEDIATYRGQLCALDDLGRVFRMDYNSLQITQLSPPWSIACEMKLKYFFDFCGDLYLLDMATGVGYMLSLRLQKWLHVEDIKDKPLSALLPYLIKTHGYGGFNMKPFKFSIPPGRHFL